MSSVDHLTGQQVSGHTFICQSRQQLGFPCNCGAGVVSLPRYIAGARDDVNHPSHYTSHPSGIECIQVTEHMSFNLGNAIKYIWRAGLKSPDAVKDLQKAVWYLNREITRLQRGQDNRSKEHGDASSSAKD